MAAVPRTDRATRGDHRGRALEQPVRWLRRIGPALLLVLLAPIIAEFLLGDFTIRNLPIVIALIPLYGCGALLIREIARRTHRGWPTIVLLATAYALLEEGFATQSLFNPDYVGQRLLDYSYIPVLGTSLNWSFFVLSIHVVWSVATPILIAEGMAARRRTEPWLTQTGVAITAMLFVVGCLSTSTFSLRASPFVATRPEFFTAAVLAAVAIGAAFAIRPAEIEFIDRSLVANGHTAPRPWAVMLVAFLLAVVFLGVESHARSLGMAPAVSLLTRAASEITAVVLIVRWSRMRGWGPTHYLALATSAVLTYSLFGLQAFLLGRTNLGVPTDAVDIVGQILQTLAVLLLIAWAVRRNRA